MMIGPEGYYEENLKGKNAAQVMTAIRSLKREISRLKNEIEHPEYQCMMHPSEATKVWCYRMYLERAKEALAELGEVYKPTKAEQRALEFDASIPNISKIQFHIGGFLSGFTDVMVTIGDEVCIEVNGMLNPISSLDSDGEYFTKEEFFDAIRDLHLGEWNRSYNLKKYDVYVLDGTQWEIIIEFNNGAKPFKAHGDNAYPYNFEGLLELFGIDNYFEDGEEGE